LLFIFHPVGYGNLEKPATSKLNALIEAIMLKVFADRGGTFTDLVAVTDDPKIVDRLSTSYATQTAEGTRAWDIFMSLVATTRNLGISFYEYMRDRFARLGKIPSLGATIREKSAANPFGVSWMPG
jgi:hypothetical protein